MISHFDATHRLSETSTLFEHKVARYMSVLGTRWKLNTLGSYSQVLGKRECDIDKWITVTLAILVCSFEAHAQFLDKAVSYLSIYIPTLTCGHKL